jgi:hypothetical protein
MVELTSFVARHVSIAPDSAGRILRHLKKQGRIGYDLVSRSKSLYRVLAVA